MTTDHAKWRHVIVLAVFTAALSGLVWALDAKSAGTVTPDRRISCWVSLEPGEPVPDAYRECQIHRAPRD